MIHVADINKVTGYVRGGCSPVGMKKQYKTVFDEQRADAGEGLCLRRAHRHAGVLCPGGPHPRCTGNYSKNYFLKKSVYCHKKLTHPIYIKYT